MRVGLLGLKVILKGILLDIEICLRSMESVWEYVWLCISSCFEVLSYQSDRNIACYRLTFVFIHDFASLTQFSHSLHFHAYIQ